MIWEPDHHQHHLFIRSGACFDGNETDIILGVILVNRTEKFLADRENGESKTVQNKHDGGSDTRSCSSWYPS